jgi:alpha-amylase
MKTINLALVLHNHQPVGNFDHVFEKAVRVAYSPFLDEFERFPDMPITLHVSGCLLEWIEARRPELLNRLSALVKAGRVEMMGGGMYEPIFVMLTDRDKLEQVGLMREYVRKRFGAPPRGAWVPERIWEQDLVTPLAAAGVEYVIVDDFHFKCAGLTEEQLMGYYLTEDQGRLMRVFASSEKLRYYIPFQDPERTIEYLRSIASDDGRRLLVYGDDGEKFGLWPETYKHVYENGWLRRFLTLLDQNKDWIKLIKLGQAADSLPPAGKVYLPDASYREMTEWALPTEAQKRLEAVETQLKSTPFYEQARPFMRGGFWRNFKVKYPESNQMYSRMTEISRKLDSIKKKPGPHQAAQRQLFHGQCNCAYWHGVFGGLYLPHLRFAVYERLIRADEIIDQALRGRKPVSEIAEQDFDMDGSTEFRLANPSVVLYLKPSRGGHLVEFDVRAKGLNLLNTLTRRAEAYHSKLLAATTAPHADGVKSIHDMVVAKSANLDKKLNYDWYLRESFVDHFFSPDTGLADFAKGLRVDAGDFVDASYQAKPSKTKSGVALALSRTGAVASLLGPCKVEVAKTIRLDGPDAGARAEYVVRNAGDTFLETIFGVEFNLAMLSADGPERHYRTAADPDAGRLSEERILEDQRELGIVDEWLKLEALLRWSPPAQVWAHPVETVSQSESGFELVFQSAAVMPRWPVRLKPGETWRVTITHEAKSR